MRPVLLPGSGVSHYGEIELRVRPGERLPGQAEIPAALVVIDKVVSRGGAVGVLDLSNKRT